MEKIMSKSSDGSKLGRAPQVRELRDEELDGVTGGNIDLGDIIRAIAKVTMIPPVSGAASPSSPSVTVNGGPLGF